MAQAIARYVNPVLDALKKLGGSAHAAEVRDAVAREMGLSKGDLEKTLKSGRSRFDNRLRWVRYHLAYAGYLDQSPRGVWTLTEKGRNAPRLTGEQVDQMLLEVQRSGIAERVDLPHE